MKTKLPNRENAYVQKEKLSNYLLSETHAIGRAKARYFRSIGCTSKNAGELENALRKIAKTCAVRQELVSEFGKKYVIDGAIASSTGESVTLRTVWIIDSRDDRPRFVTAYPV